MSRKKKKVIRDWFEYNTNTCIDEVIESSNFVGSLFIPFGSTRKLNKTLINSIKDISADLTLHLGLIIIATPFAAAILAAAACYDNLKDRFCCWPIKIACVVACVTLLCPIVFALALAICAITLPFRTIRTIVPTLADAITPNNQMA